MDEIKGMAACLLAIVIFIVTVAGIVVIGSTKLEFMIDKRIVTVTVGGKPYYEGPAPCVNVASVGAASQVSVGRGFLCLLPGMVYVGNDVRITTK